MRALTTVGDEVAAVDFMRLQPGVSGDRAYREWQHFVLRTPEVELLLNLSVLLVRDEGAALGWAEPDARATILVHHGRWAGTVERRPGAQFRAGRVEADFGVARLSFAPTSGYRLDVQCEELGLRAALQLVPLTRPLLVRDIRLAGGTRIHWCVVPRLRAAGEVETPGGTVSVDGALAYHDHNWGDWGADYSWEWGYALPEHEDASPWSAVVFRLGDRGRGTTTRQSTLLWEGAALRRVYRDAAVSVSTRGWAGPCGLTLPPVASLVRPGAGDVPASWRMRAREGSEEVVVDATPESLARLVVPEPDGTDVVVIHEASCRMRVDGRVAGAPVRIDGGGFLEGAW